MMHPAAQDDLAYVRVAIFTLHQRYRIRLWTWPEHLRQRVLNAALTAQGGEPWEVAHAVIVEARKALGLNQEGIR